VESRRLPSGSGTEVGSCSGTGYVEGTGQRARAGAVGLANFLKLLRLAAKTWSRADTATRRSRHRTSLVMKGSPVRVRASASLQQTVRGPKEALRGLDSSLGQMRADLPLGLSRGDGRGASAATRARPRQERPPCGPSLVDDKRLARATRPGRHAASANARSPAMSTRLRERPRLPLANVEASGSDPAPFERPNRHTSCGTRA
jgi:hypothetical protein